MLITLGVTTVLVAAALEYNRRARYAVVSSAAARNDLSMTEMAAAGVHVAMAILAKDKVDNDNDTPMDDWADPVHIDEVLREFPFEDGRLSLVITDELGKIQVNALFDHTDKTPVQRSPSGPCGTGSCSITPIARSSSSSSRTTASRRPSSTR